MTQTTTQAVFTGVGLDATIRCRHGIALVGGFITDVEHDGTNAMPGQSLACDDEQAKAAKREQAAGILERERAARVNPAAFVEVEEYCGDPDDPMCGPDLGKPWCNYHAGTATNPYAA